MKGIKQSNCKFYVNEEERVVVCVIPHTSDMLYHFIREHFDWSDMSIYLGMCHRLEDLVQMPNSFMGKAVCAEEDEWDEELGKTIAFSRAKDKCYQSFFRRANALVQRIDARLGDMITQFNDFGTKLGNKKEIMDAKIEEMING